MINSGERRGVVSYGEPTTIHAIIEHPLSLNQKIEKLIFFNFLELAEFIFSYFELIVSHIKYKLAVEKEFLWKVFVN